MVAPLTEALEASSRERVRNALNTISETLVEEFGMEPDDVGSLMLDAGNTVAGQEGDVYLNVVKREIEQRLGISLSEKPGLPRDQWPRRNPPRQSD